MSDQTFEDKIRNMLPWLPGYLWRRCSRHSQEIRPVHLVIALADHFEPSFHARNREKRPSRWEQEQRVETWCREYPSAVDRWRDEEGQPLRHTYFYPAEEYDEAIIDRLADFCHAGWGEIEIHLHHGVDVPDNASNTRQALLSFRDALAVRGCLSQENGAGSPRYAFVHGNWALANSAGGRFCGVDDEMRILADTGCYADFTLPAPTRAQVPKVNALYECALPLDQRAPHRRGVDLECGRIPRVFPLIVQGPLVIFRRRRRPFFGIENGELSGSYPPTIPRVKLWQDASIVVRGRPDWLFIKLHCHGMNPADEPSMVGSSIQHFLRDLVQSPENRSVYLLHFVTAREMTNIILAACDGCSGNPGEFRDYRFQLIQSPHRNYRPSRVPQTIASD